MPAITIACPECDAKLKLADKSKLGKKIKCPKCEEVFVAKAADDEDDFDDDDEDDEDEKPRGKKRAAAAGAGKKGAPAKKGKGKGKSGGSKLGLIIGGAIGAVVLLVGGLIGILFATGVFGGGKVDPNQMTIKPVPGDRVFERLLKEKPSAAAANGAQFDQKWFPSDVEILVHVRVADLWQAPLLKSLTTTPQATEFLKPMKEFTGLEPGQIESATLLFPGLKNWLVETKLANDAGNNQPSQKHTPPALAIIKLKQPIPEDAIGLALKATKQQHQGKSYWEVASSPQVPEAVALHFAEPQLVLVGEPSGIQQAIARGPNSTPRPEWNFLDPTQHLLIAGSTGPLDPKLEQKLNDFGTDAPGLVASQRQYAEKAQGGSVGLRITGGIDAVISVACKSPTAAQEIKRDLESGLAELTKEYQANKGTVPGFIVELADLALGNTKTAEQNQVVRMTVSIPESAQEKLAQLPSMLMLMGMTSGLGGGNSPLSSLFGGGAPNGRMPPGSPGDSSGTDTIPPPFTPGEASNAEPTAIENLPPGFSLNGSLKDDQYQRAQPSDRPLGFYLEWNYQGEGADCQVAAVGNLQNGQVVDGNGDSDLLKVSNPFSDQADDPQWELMNNGEGFSFFSNFVGGYEFVIPSGDTKPIKTLEGKFSYIKGNRSKLIQIKDFRKQAGKPLTDPALKGAGVELKLSKEQDVFGPGETLIVTVKPGFLLTKLQVIDDKGEISFDAFPGISPNRETQTLKPGAGDMEFKPGLGIQLYVYSDLEEVEVPFTFEDIPLPKKADGSK